MIAYLRGRITQRQPPELVLEAAGVGYRVLATMAAFEKLPSDDTEALLPTHLVIREDAHTLYGFADEAERALFCQLLKISGIGAQTALAILSTLPGAQLRQYVQAGDVQSLLRVPGIGKKTAQRLLLELQHALQADAMGESTTPQHEAMQALISLGWKPAEARRMVQACDSQGQDAEAIIRQALMASPAAQGAQK